MTTATRLLREEHRELLPHLEHILSLAHDIEPGRDEALAERVMRVYGFLQDHLLDHARVEEEVLYPVVARAVGAPEVTATMSRDHEEIGAMVEKLGAVARSVRAGVIGVSEARELRRLLYGLHAVVRLHFLKEEEVYLPWLDERLTQAEGLALMEALEGAR